MDKIRKLVESHDKIKAKNKELEYKDASNQIQLEMLVKRVKETHDKKEEFKRELIQTKKTNVKISRQMAGSAMDVHSRNGNLMDDTGDIFMKDIIKTKTKKRDKAKVLVD